MKSFPSLFIFIFNFFVKLIDFNFVIHSNRIHFLLLLIQRAGHELFLFGLQHGGEELELVLDLAVVG
jgi:hypothetical protein